MSFKDRLTIAERWSNECIEDLSASGWLVVPMGAENVAPEVQNALSMMRNPDATARFVRYMPDGFAVMVESEEAMFYDAKCGKSIEKDAYIAYMAFAGDNRRVYVRIKNGKDKYNVPVRKLMFLNSHKEVEKYPVHLQMPIDEDGWIAPRLWCPEKYNKWKYRYSTASGTPFKYFDFDAISEFKEGS